MNSEKLIQKIKYGDDKEIEKAKNELEYVFKSEKNSKLFLKAVIDNLESFSRMEREENKITFIYGLKLVVSRWGRDYFPLFSKFIVDQIEDDSERVRSEIVQLTDLLTDQVSKEDLLPEERSVLVELIDNILILMENYYDYDYQQYKTVEDLPPSKYKSLELLMKKITKEDSEKVIPEWLDCTWKREICSKIDCPVCSKIREVGEMTGNFGKSQFLLEVMDGSDELKEDCPTPEEFPFYLEIEKWMKELAAIAERSKEGGEFWIFTEEAADLFWYINVLSVKSYRQLCNRFLIDEGVNRGFDYQYTRKIIIKSVRVIKKSIKVIIESTPEEIDGLKRAVNKLQEMEARIYNI